MGGEHRVEIVSTDTVLLVLDQAKRDPLDDVKPLLIALPPYTLNLRFFNYVESTDFLHHTVSMC